MEKFNFGFLKLHKVQEKPEAIKAGEKEARKTGDKEYITDKDKRIESYIKRLENVFLNEDLEIRQRYIELLKPKIYENTIIKDEDFPESHFVLQKRILKERGMGEIEFNDKQKKDEIERVQDAQKKSLDEWINYLTGEDCKYSSLAKYFAMQGILKLGDFEDKSDKYSFTKRLPSTTLPFPEVDREALSIVLGAIDGTNNEEEIKKLIKNGNNFGDVYASAMFQEDKRAGKKELIPNTNGKWVKFEKGSEARILSDSLVGKRSNLCIRDLGSAESYLKQVDVEIYFSEDKNGEFTVPRIAVALNDKGVYEVRGTYNKNEDLDPYMEETSILKDKLATIPNGEKYLKKDSDMKKLTSIYKKVFEENKKTGEKTFVNNPLDKEDLRFLYQIDSKIEGFGYEDDPRILEILNTRNKTEDANMIFDNKIATSVGQIKEDTIVYIGKEKGIFTKLQNIKYIYTSFPDKKMEVFKPKEMEYPNTGEEWVNIFKERNVYMGDGTDKMLEKMQTSKLPEDQKFIKLTVEDLFRDNQNHKYEDILRRAEDLDLEPCEQDDGPKLRLSTEQNPGDRYITCMKLIELTDGSIGLWELNRLEGNIMNLNRSDGRPERGFYLGTHLVFRVSKYNNL